MSHTLLILKIYTTFKDVQMMLKIFFDISTGLRFSKISVECSIHLCSCPWIRGRTVFLVFSASWKFNNDKIKALERLLGLVYPCISCNFSLQIKVVPGCVSWLVCCSNSTRVSSIYCITFKRTLIEMCENTNCVL